MAVSDPYDDWQTTVRNIREGISALYLQKDFTDVEFLVGENDQNTFRAHQLILSSRSPVFAKLFNRAFTALQTPISVPDVEPQAFLRMLKWVYMDLELDCNEKETLAVYQVAEKYNMPYLKQECERRLSILTPSLEIESICWVLEKAEEFSIESLIDPCLQRFSQHTHKIIATESFFRAKSSTVRFILQLEIVNVKSELELILALINWARRQFHEHFVQDGKRSVRSVLDPLLPFIRFRCLNSRDWAIVVHDNPEIFTHKENVSLFKFLANRLFSEVPNWCDISSTRKFQFEGDKAIVPKISKEDERIYGAKLLNKGDRRVAVTKVKFCKQVQ